MKEKSVDNTTSTKQQVQSTEPKRRGRKPKSKSPFKEVGDTTTKTKELELAMKVPSPLGRRTTARRLSAINATNAIPAMLRSEQSSPDSPQLDIPVPLPPSTTRTKVTTWLKKSETDAIPTQDRPVITNTPITQSTLISVSQNKLFEKSPHITQIPEDNNTTERIVKDPYEFIPSQPDSIIKKPRGGLKVKAKPANQKKDVLSRKKKTGVVGVNENEEEQDMLLFKSQSEKYIAEQEEKRLKELEKPIYITTAAATKRKSLRSKSLALKHEDKLEDSEEPHLEQGKSIFVSSGQPIKTYRGTRGKSLPQYQQDEEENKIQKLINEAEKHSLVIEKKKIETGTKKSQFTSQIQSKESNKRSLSIAIDSPAVSESPKHIITVAVTPDESKYLEKAGFINKSKLGMPSPGFSRIKKMKSDFRSPGRNFVVPLDVSTTSVAPKDLSTSVAPQLELELESPATERPKSKSVRFDSASPVPSNANDKQKLQESFNSSFSSLGAPDLERGVELMKAVEKMEYEIQNNILNDSDLETTFQDTQQSTTLIENSVPPETRNVALFKSIPKEQIVESTQESSLQAKEIAPITDNQIDITPQNQVSPLKESSNKNDSQNHTQMSQTTVSLLEKIHDLKSDFPKRKTFSLELNTGDIMTDIPSRESTQQQLLSLTSPSQNKCEQNENFTQKKSDAGN